MLLTILIFGGISFKQIDDRLHMWFYLVKQGEIKSLDLLTLRQSLIIISDVKEEQPFLTSSGNSL